MSQNVTVLDRAGAFATVFLGPDRAPLVTDARVCTNHQDRPIPPQQEARTRTGERQAYLGRCLDQPAADLPALTQAMLQPPLHRGCREDGFATVYTALYRPAEGTVDFIWPGKTWRQSFRHFEPGSYRHVYAVSAA
jgi:predicted choloylglycine hydrolase